MKENPGNNSIIDNNLNASKSIVEEVFSNEYKSFTDFDQGNKELDKDIFNEYIKQCEKSDSNSDKSSNNSYKNSGIFLIVIEIKFQIKIQLTFMRQYLLILLKKIIIYSVKMIFCMKV